MAQVRGARPAPRCPDGGARSGTGQRHLAFLSSPLPRHAVAQLTETQQPDGSDMPRLAHLACDRTVFAMSCYVRLVRFSFLILIGRFVTLYA